MSNCNTSITWLKASTVATVRWRRRNFFYKIDIAQLTFDINYWVIGVIRTILLIDPHGLVVFPLIRLVYVYFKIPCRESFLHLHWNSEVFPWATHWSTVGIAVWDLYLASTSHCLLPTDGCLCRSPTDRNAPYPPSNRQAASLTHPPTISHDLVG